jgi:hypothetical protein
VAQNLLRGTYEPHLQRADVLYDRFDRRALAEACVVPSVSSYVSRWERSILQLEPRAMRTRAHWLRAPCPVAAHGDGLARFMAFRLLASVPNTVFQTLLYLRLRRLVPFAIAHALMDGASVLIGVLLPLLRA